MTVPDHPPGVIVEFYGLTRSRAGRAELIVPPGTAAEVLAAVALACPDLSGVVTTAGEVAPQYLLSLDGQRFLADLHLPLNVGDRLLLLGADAGG